MRVGIKFRPYLAAARTEMATSGQLVQRPAASMSNHFDGARLANGDGQQTSRVELAATKSSSVAELTRTMSEQATSYNQQRPIQSGSAMQRAEKPTELGPRRRSSARHETDSASSSSSELSGQREPAERSRNEEAAGAADQTDKPHAGPMGIFFKVWSLVKGKQRARSGGRLAPRRTVTN